MTIRMSNSRQVNENDNYMVPFMFDENSKNKPCYFEFQFIASDKLKYTYGFSATKTEIFDEYLYVNKSKKASKIFTRSQNTYNFTSVYRKELKPITEKNTNNKLFLATATAWNSKSTKAPFEWLASGIDIHPNEIDYLSRLSLEYYASDDVARCNEFATKMIKSADINVKKLDITHENIVETKQDMFLSYESQENNSAKIAIKVDLVHNVYDDNSKNFGASSPSVVEV